MRVVLFVQFILSKNIVDMLSDCFFITGKQNGHLIGTKPYGFIFQPNINGSLAIISLVYDYLVFFHLLYN